MACNGLKTRPLYLQVRDVLADCITQGRWKPGASIPNELDLAREYGVSTGTMRKALDLMEGEHIVTRQQGRGTFVTDQTTGGMAIRFSNIRDAKGERITGHAEMIAATEGRAHEYERARLRLGMDDPVYRIRYVRRHESRAFTVEETSMPAALFPGLLETNEFPHDISGLAQSYGMLVGNAEERISVDAATPAVAEELCLAPAAPILVMDRVIRTLDGCPIEWRVARCHLLAHHYLAEMS